MRKTLGVLVFAASITVPQIASAQALPTGAELIGHSARVETNGQVSTVYFDPGGTARIVSDTGREAQGTWFVENGSLCLQTTERECWPYQTPFQAGVPVDLTSTCAATSRWTALSTNQPAPVQQPSRAGERG